MTTGSSIPRAAPPWLGWVLALVATAAFSIATPLSRFAILAGMTPTNLLLARLWLSLLLLGFYVWWSRPGQLRLAGPALLAVLVVGVANGISTLAYFEALRYLDASLAIMLFAANPVVVLGLLALRGEALTSRHFIRMTLALLGVYLLIGPGGHVHWLGALLILGTIFFFSVQMVGVQWYLRSYPPSVLTFYIALIAALVTTMWWLCQPEPWFVPGISGWLVVIALALVSTFLARICFYTAIQQLGSGQMALLMPTETMLSVLWALLFLGEHLSVMQTLGAGLIVASALLAAERWGQRWRAAPKPSGEVVE